MPELLSDNPLAALIVACEAGFWILLAGGLVTRYLLRLRRPSTALLVSVPALDVVLVAATALDVARGTPPTAIHGLAGLYLGFTVAFGHATVRWADGWFAHLFAGGPRPVPADRYGAARVRKEWREWGRLILAWAVGLVVILGTSLLAGRGVPAPAAWATDPLWSTGLKPAGVAVIWLVVGPVWTTLNPPREKVLHVPH